MVNLGKHWAWVEVDGQILPEYQPQVSPNGVEVVVWIPSESGKTFQLCIRDADFSYPWATRISVDGKVLRGGKVIRDRMRATAIHKGVAISESMYKPFVFSLCKLVEDDDPSALSNPSPAIGELKIEVEEVLLLRHSTHAAPVMKEFPDLTVSEKAKKGIVHGTLLGKAVSKRNKKPWKLDTIRPVATFIFRYRPLAVLQANGVAPRPRQEKTASGVECLDLTLKDEPFPSAQVVYNKDKVKRERSTTLSNEIIDLT